MNLLITAPMRESERKKLQQYFDKIVYHPWTEHVAGYNAQTILEMLRQTNANALISELDEINADVLDAYHDLIFIGDCRANPANIDIAAATKYRIPVICTPARNAQAVAELMVGALICFLRNVPDSLKWIDDGKWQPGTTPYHLFMGHEICGKKIGFVGFGAVGKAAAKLLQAFQTEIVFYDPYVESSDTGYAKLSLDELFSTADVVSIHLPVLPSTKGMIGEKLLALMKPDAVFVNTSRSAVVDMQALKQILKAKKIKGAVLDVYDHEPPEQEDLEIMSLPNVLATPHICGATYEVTDHQSQIVCDGIEKWFAKDARVRRLVFNKDVL